MNEHLDRLQQLTEYLDSNFQITLVQNSKEDEMIPIQYSKSNTQKESPKDVIINTVHQNSARVIFYAMRQQ